ncbi:MAG TPA: sigma-70 family RNA polymerase sigma factor, partial [Rhizobiaceae bacterium]|nr:sigma-70 family RNA polymerase sigma factor [Rhizobiaceae bacterium]
MRDAKLENFLANTPAMRGLAYRMTGSASEPDDIVQEAWLRWQAATGDIANPRSYLLAIVANLCLDRAKSARRKREIYVGQWLPEPVADADPLLTTQRPDHAAESADSVSTAFLLALERLTAPERAALLLHDVFDFSFEEVAAMLARTPQGCRQLASRARKRVREARPNPPAPPREAERLTKALLAVMQGGDLAGFAAMLAQDAVLVSDGGGMKAAAPNPILGAERVLRFLAGLAA